MAEGVPASASGGAGCRGAAGAYTAASSSGERDRGGTGTAPEDGRGEGGEEGERGSLGCCPQDLGPSARGDRLRPRGPGKRLKRTAVHTQDQRFFMLLGMGLDTHTHAHTMGQCGFPTLGPPLLVTLPVGSNPACPPPGGLLVGLGLHIHLKARGLGQERKCFLSVCDPEWDVS